LRDGILYKAASRGLVVEPLPSAGICVKSCPKCRADVEDRVSFCPFCGQDVRALPAAEADPFLQRVLAGNFRIEELLGAGAMGRVYRATQLSLGKPVAVKILHRRLLGDPHLEKRFHREAQAASRLSHPNSIQVFEYGTAEDGSLFIVMELLEGRDLGQLVRDEHPLSWSRICLLLAQACSALDEAHAAGIIHRDLKPENIIVLGERRGTGEQVKVLDFGIAKVQDARDRQEGEAPLTFAGMVCGTPEYMSPEQARGIEVTAAADIYALGVILYQLITGLLPFEGPSTLAIITKQISDRPVPPAQRRPDLAIPPALEELCLAALAKDPAARPASARELRERLLAIHLEASSGESLAASSPAVQASLPATDLTPLPVWPGEAALPPAALAPRPSAPRRGRWLLLLLPLLLLGGAAAFWLLPREQAVAPGPEEPRVRITKGYPVGKRAGAASGTAASPSTRPADPGPGTATPGTAAPGTAAPGTAAPGSLQPAARPPSPTPAAATEPTGGAKKPPASGPAARPAGGSRAPAPAGDERARADEAFARGRAAFLRGDIAGAIAAYEQAARTRSPNPEVYYELGRCYVRIQDKEAAVRNYQRYTRLGKNPDKVRSAAASITSLTAP